MTNASEQVNYTIFRECLSDYVISKIVDEPVKQRRRAKARGNISSQGADSSDGDRENEKAVGELAEFVEYIAFQIFSSLTADLRTISYNAVQKDLTLVERYADLQRSETLDPVSTCLPPAVIDSLDAYGILPTGSDVSDLLATVLSAYIASATAAPAPYSSTRASACELCQRDWIPLTYHHLIPRSTHSKALKRGWAADWELNKVAWLCRACHSFVHRIEPNESLARQWNSVDKLRERADVQKFVNWVSSVRWKKS